MSEDVSLLHLLIVDDNPADCKACAELAQAMRFTVSIASTLAKAQGVLARHPIDILLLDLKLPDEIGYTLLDEVRTRYPETVIVVMTAHASVRSAVEAMRLGASDYLTKPISREDLNTVLQRAVKRRSFDGQSRALRERLRNGTGMGALVGRSPAMEKLYRILSKVAFTQHPVLIVGELGTGKELVARSIHTSGPNAGKPFVPVDCGAMAPELLERELFGYVKGAFSGAVRARQGLLAAADSGTVFLDEVSDLPLDLQARLLRALQEKEIRPAGANSPVAIAARVLAATSRDLAGMVESGRFRKDLYYRLNVVNVRIPPLRDRKSDIPLLAEHILGRLRRENGLSYTLAGDALRLLTGYDWPGNVRELEHALERATALANGTVLHAADFPTNIRHGEAEGRSPNGAAALLKPLEVTTLAEMERQVIERALQQLGGDKPKAARLLGIGKTTLYRKIKEYGLDMPGGHRSE